MSPVCEEKCVKLMRRKTIQAAEDLNENDENIAWQTRHSPVRPSSPTLMLKKGLSCASFLFVRFVITTGRLSATLSRMMFTYCSEERGASRICCCWPRMGGPEAAGAEGRKVTEPRCR